MELELTVTWKTADPMREQMAEQQPAGDAGMFLCSRLGEHDGFIQGDRAL
jgi:hypothetical protein